MNPYLMVLLTTSLLLLDYWERQSHTSGIQMTRRERERKDATAKTGCTEQAYVTGYLSGSFT